MTSIVFESNVVIDLCVPSSVNVIGVGPNSLPETEAISLEAGCYINHVQLSRPLPISVYLLLHRLV